MSASYPSSAKAFTTKVDGAGNLISASHINDLQAEVTAIETDLLGPLAVARGGSGVATHTAHGVLIGEGTSAVATTAAGTAGQVFTSGGASADPAFATPTIVSVLTDGATPALDASLTPAWLTGLYTLAAAGDRTIAVPSNPTSGQKIIIRHLASGGGRTLALNTGAGGFHFGSDITALSQTASGKYDYIACVYNAAASLWDVVGYVKGF